MGTHLAAGAEQGEPDRIDEGVRLLREALGRGRSLCAAVDRLIRIDLATALMIRSRLRHTDTDREEAESILGTAAVQPPSAT